ncbi:DUF1998 domain-containing protein [Lacticaseibacillus hulanensis]|uniref:DUF1998 domain-containing protein n=1 Tax=Lacticaseibacillus hulanensis TaxID=2493111 RepID=UPI0013E2E339|nr:DUF1998 domain-containing protein [Lacticaseibacillus hulanensis]
MIQNNRRNGKFHREGRYVRSEENQIRRSQLITPFGTGALTDIKNRSVMVADSDFWDAETVDANSFYDNRLQQAMHAEGFIEPPAGTQQDTVSVKTFPSWYFSPKTRELRSIWSWERLLPGTNTSDRLHQQFEREPFHLWLNEKTSKRVHIDLIPVRIVCACANGHVQDFPWYEWAHSSGSVKKDVTKHVLMLKNIGGSGTIGDMWVSCCCGKSRSLRGIFSDFAGDTLKKIGVTCRGQFGWEQKNISHSCNALIKPMMRNSNSLYFPNVEKSVNIPLKENATLEQIQSTAGFLELENALSQYSDVSARRKALYEPWSRSALLKISSNIYGSDESEEHLEAIRSRIVDYQGFHDSGESISETDYRREEYAVLMGEKEYREDTDRFDMRSIGTDEFPNNIKTAALFDRITLVNQLEVVSILKSFSRIRPIESQWMIDQEGSERSEEGKGQKAAIKEVSLKRTDGRYVGLRNRGEGIFVSLDKHNISEWRKRIKKTNFENRIIRKISKVSSDYEQEYIDPAYYLIHTLSHLVIRELSFASGYSSSALQERIYYSDGNDDEQMCGFLIYTSSSDSEGTLGGLVRQGLPSNFFEMLKGAIEKARWCSFDPTCIESNGQGRNSLNLAACHACALVSETSCERMNLFLDRGVLIGTLEHPEYGFFSETL